MSVLMARVGDDDGDDGGNNNMRTCTHDVRRRMQRETERNARNARAHVAMTTTSSVTVDVVNGVCIKRGVVVVRGKKRANDRARDLLRVIYERLKIHTNTESIYRWFAYSQVVVECVNIESRTHTHTHTTPNSRYGV